ncbi:MAG TPA: methylisocitrate lyase [Nitrososphaerales archaeon]|nr:methylisocitrate lyase [Nitrososphaerales archaeon]
MAKQAAALRRLVQGGRTVLAPGVFSPFVAQMAVSLGFKAVYFSGAGFSNLLGLPDLGVVTLSEVSGAVGGITAVVDVPVIVDADTGFGEAVNVARTVQQLKATGAAALQIEDQVQPKKCGHLEGKELVGTEEMLKKMVTAREASSGDILVVARTDARAVEGLDRAVERARSYSRAGADIIFPEALESREEFVEFRSKVGIPLLANMTEFGKTPYLSAGDFEEMGYNIVIFPVTAFRAAMLGAWRALEGLKVKGTQREFLGSLMTRKEVYRLIRYDEYERMDRKAGTKARKYRPRRA